MGDYNLSQHQLKHAAWLQGMYLGSFGGAAVAIVMATIGYLHYAPASPGSPVRHATVPQSQVAFTKLEQLPVGGMGEVSYNELGADETGHLYISMFARIRWPQTARESRLLVWRTGKDEVEVVIVGEPPATYELLSSKLYHWRVAAVSRRAAAPAPPLPPPVQ